MRVQRLWMVIPRTKVVLIAILGVVLLIGPTAKGLGVYQELPNRVSIGEPNQDVLVQISDRSGDWRGVCEITLFWANTNGATIESLDHKDSTCRWEDSYYYTDFSFSFTVTRQMAEYDKDYQFVVEAIMESDSGNTYPKESEYGVRVNPRINAEFTADLEGLTVMVDGSPSFTEGNDDLDFIWDWGTGTEQGQVSSSSPRTEYTYEEPGEYEVQLVVEDPFGQAASTERTLTVQDRVVRGLPGPSWGTVAVATLLGAVLLVRYGRKRLG